MDIDETKHDDKNDMEDDGDSDVLFSESLPTHDVTERQTPNPRWEGVSWRTREFNTPPESFFWRKVIDDVVNDSAAVEIETRVPAMVYVEQGNSVSASDSTQRFLHDRPDLLLGVFAYATHHFKLESDKQKMQTAMTRWRRRWDDVIQQFGFTGVTPQDQDADVLEQTGGYWWLKQANRIYYRLLYDDLVPLIHEKFTHDNYDPDALSSFYTPTLQMGTLPNFHNRLFKRRPTLDWIELSACLKTSCIIALHIYRALHQERRLERLTYHRSVVMPIEFEPEIIAMLIWRLVRDTTGVSSSLLRDATHFVTPTGNWKYGKDASIPWPDLRIPATGTYLFGPYEYYVQLLRHSLFQPDCNKFRMFGMYAAFMRTIHPHLSKPVDTYIQHWISMDPKFEKSILDRRLQEVLHFSDAIAMDMRAGSAAVAEMESNSSSTRHEIRVVVRDFGPSIERGIIVEISLLRRGSVAPFFLDKQLRIGKVEYTTAVPFRVTAYVTVQNKHGNWIQKAIDLMMPTPDAYSVYQGQGRIELQISPPLLHDTTTDRVSHAIHANVAVVEASDVSYVNHTRQHRSFHCVQVQVCRYGLTMGQAYVGFLHKALLPRKRESELDRPPATVDVVLNLLRVACHAVGVDFDDNSMTAQHAAAVVVRAASLVVLTRPYEPEERGRDLFTIPSTFHDPMLASGDCEDLSADLIVCWEQLRRIVRYDKTATSSLQLYHSVFRTWHPLYCTGSIRSPGSDDDDDNFICHVYVVFVSGSYLESALHGEDTARDGSQPLLAECTAGFPCYFSMEQSMREEQSQELDQLYGRKYQHLHRRAGHPMRSARHVKESNVYNITTIVLSDFLRRTTGWGEYYAATQGRRETSEMGISTLDWLYGLHMLHLVPTMTQQSHEYEFTMVQSVVNNELQSMRAGLPAIVPFRMVSHHHHNDDELCDGNGTARRILWIGRDEGPMDENSCSVPIAGNKNETIRARVVVV